MAGTSLSSVENLLREEISQDVWELTAEMDPTYNEMVRTSANVSMSGEGIGKGYWLKRAIRTGVAGGFKWVGITGGATNTGDATYALNQTFVHSTQQSFPSRSEMSSKGNGQFQWPLSKGHGNLELSLDMAQALMLPGALSGPDGEYVTSELKGNAELLAQYFANSFFAYTDNRLHTISGLDDSLKANGQLTWTVSAGRITTLRAGMFVDVYSTGYVKRNSSELLVDYVSPLDGVIIVKSPTGANLSGFSIADGDYVFQAGAYGTQGGDYGATRNAPFGLLDWMKQTGVLFGPNSNMDTSKFPELKSLVVSRSAPLDERFLTRQCRRFDQAYGPGKLDTILTTGGVTQLFSEQPSLQPGSLSWDRTGKPNELVAGDNGVRFILDGKKFKWRSSAICLPGYLFVLKTGGGNLKVHVPPGRPGSGTNSTFGNEVRFIAKERGSTTIFEGTRTSDGAPEAMLEMPYQVLYQRSTDDPRGIVIADLTEAELND